MRRSIFPLGFIARKIPAPVRPSEVEALIRAAKDGRHGARDALMISLAYHHGLLVTEVVELEWDAMT